ncbi:nucleoside deaminase [Hufsiella ginkgonis]|uniref:Nucleoside deaminase n=1 Tax=Hufsiella ginkgonis TaxID=2695274 RepID=A0A7K1Y1P3_9SPHI|nr:nucleoside deaminase [Hufsiella ginkgonis]MXV17170.1 nucleoside deaminase [Hufsiella ginkgonis]
MTTTPEAEAALHEKFMRMAIRLSSQNVKKALGGPFGAVIVKDGRLVAKSANKVTTTCDPTAHAEVSAIRLAAKKLNTFDLSGCVIYTSCEPCPMCLGAIYWAKINRVFYGNNQGDAASIGFNDQFIYEELALPMHGRRLTATRILQHEALEAFELWKKSDFKIAY